MKSDTTKYLNEVVELKQDKGGGEGLLEDKSPSKN